MKNMLSYNNFISEKSGIIDELETIADDIISKIGNKKRLVYKINYLGNDLTINIYYGINKYNKEFVGDFSVEDVDKYIFNIRLTEMDKPVLIHELKHLDRSIRRNLKTDVYYYITHVGKYITKQLNFLFYDKEEIQFLIDTFYYCTQDEFEAHYHNMYYDIKNEIKHKDNDNKQNTIKNIIENEYIYKIYKHYYYDKFNLMDFFYSNKDANIFLKEFAINMGLFYDGKDMKVTTFDKIKYLVKSKLSRITKAVYVDDKELLNQLNFYINKTVQNNYKKFHKLYNMF